MRCAPHLLFLLVPLLAGCTGSVGPDYEPIVAHVPDHYLATASADVATPIQRSADEAAQSDWWVLFQDPRLSALIERAERGNLDLKTALSRVRQARQYEVMARAQLLPQFGLSAGAEGGLLSNATLFPNAVPAGIPNSFSVSDEKAAEAGVGLDASWEVDVFGRTRRQIEAAQDGIEEAGWRARFAQMLVAAEVAKEYVRLRGSERRIGILQKQVAEQRARLTMHAADEASGDASGLAFQQQRIALSETEGKIVPLTAEKQILTHQLNVLVGEAPEVALPELAGADSLRNPKPPAAMPSDLLRRRPDIRAAERKVAGTTAKLGVAVADLFPRFMLSAEVGPRFGLIQHILNWNSLAAEGGAGITMPLFAGGRIRANIAVKAEDQVQALLEYRKAVLGALQDVEDAQSRYAAASKQVAIARRALAAARKAVQMTASMNVAGLTDKNDPLAAQCAEMEAQDKLAMAETGVSLATIDLFKALGGGWRAEPSAGEAHEPYLPPPLEMMAGAEPASESLMPATASSDTTAVPAGKTMAASTASAPGPAQEPPLDNEMPANKEASALANAPAIRDTPLRLLLPDM